jgi:lipid A 4'-phosphatase
MKNVRLAEFLIPFLAAVAVTGALTAADADLTIQSLFFSSQAGWLHAHSEPWAFLYHYGNIPAFALTGLGGIVFVLSFISARFRDDRKAGLFIVVFLALGPGLVVNTLLKDHWGRPRPADIVNFGGTETYRPFWNPGTPERGRAFPSGHAAIGFFLMAPYFVLMRNNPRWARKALAAGILYGMLMGLGRMIQGGHFLTDVIWSGFLIYLTGLFLYYLFRMDREDLLLKTTRTPE